MRKSSLWKDLQSLTADFLDEVLYWAKNEPVKDINAPTLGLRRKASRPLSSSSQTLKTKSLSEKLNEISSSLKNLIDKSEANKLQKGVIHGSDLSYRPQLEPQKPRLVEEMKMIGRSEDLEQLKTMLLMQGEDEESPLQIIPIVGEEGIGKTTLAQAVYDHEEIKNHFDLRIWVSASASAEPKQVSENIMEALAPNMRAELESVDEITAVLLEELEGKSFFLVLDDVSCNKADLPRLKFLKDFLTKLKTTRRNKIVITTSSTETAKEMASHYQLHLKKLSDADSKEILQKMSGDIQINDIEKSIAFTGGIPLAVKVLGSTIYNLQHLHRMEETEINHQLHSDLENKQEEYAALNLSYVHLPQEVQQCFAYMSIFPHNTLIEKGNIIQLWMAHGFVQPEEHTEDLLEQCLHILLNSCLIEPAERDSYENISSVRLSRVAWELASNKLKLEKTHVSIHAGEPLVQPSEKTAKLRTFFSVGSKRIVSYGEYNFQSLKVLNLSKSQFTMWPDEFESLIHLRYIDVSGTKVVELPESINQLIYLQTIRALHCTYLEKLPKDLSNLEDLRHLCIDAENEAIRKGNMPSGLGTLSCLQTLPLIVVTKDPKKSVEVLLRPLVNLRGKMTVCNLEHLTPKEAEEWDLNGKKGIDELIYEWTMNSPPRPTDTDNKILEKLQPNVMLKSLTLQNFPGSEITMWKNVDRDASKDTALIRNIVKLKLSNCNNCEKLPTLGTLPSLTELHLEGMEKLESIEPEFYTDKTTAEESGATLFPVLKKFTMMYLAKLKSWSTAEGADSKVFPLLEELRVEGCDELVSTPSHFPSLKLLHVERISSGEPLANICSNLTTLTSVFISSVLNLQSLPEGILRTNPNLSSLRIWNCHELTEIQNRDTLGCSNSLRSLSINECEKLNTLPENLHKASSLKELILSRCNSLKSIPSVYGLCSLRRLKIELCNSLESLPSGLGLQDEESTSHKHSSSSLEHLMIKGCPNLISVQDEGLSKLTSLCSVNIQGCGRLTALPLRELLHYLKKLKRLEIEGFAEDHLGLTIEYPGLNGWIRFKELPKPLQTKKIKGVWTIDPNLLETFTTKALGFLEALQLFETGVKAITQ